MAEHRTPFVLGKPIKNPADFYGREDILGELFELVLGGHLVALVGEHRSGNTSVIYQMLVPEVRRQHLRPDEDEALVLAFVSAQLASEGPEALYRRLQRGLRRADPDAGVDFRADPDRLWLEEYLEDLSDRRHKLGLLIDEFEVLADFDESFWEWFEGLITHFDVAIVATTRQDLGAFRSKQGRGPAFFNMFRSVYLGSFKPETLERFLNDKSEITEFDFNSVRDELSALAGRFPFYLQSAAALYYFHAAGGGEIDQETHEAVARDYRSRVWMLLDDAWRKLPAVEQEALTWMVLDDRPGGDAEMEFTRALQSLERRGYVVDGRIFSKVFADYVREQYHRVGISTLAGTARVGRRLVDVDNQELAMLRALLEAGNQTVTRQAIATAIWPDRAEEGRSLPTDRIDEIADRLRNAIESDGGGEILESHGAHGFALNNPGWPTNGSREA